MVGLMISLVIMWVFNDLEVLVIVIDEEVLLEMIGLWLYFLIKLYILFLIDCLVVVF